MPAREASQSAPFTLNWVPMTKGSHELASDGGAAMEVTRVRSGVAATDETHRIRRYQVVWAEGGYGEQDVDFTRYPLQANRIYLTVPGQVHGWRDNAIQGRVFVFSDTLLDGVSREQLLFGSGLYGWAGARPVVELGNHAASELVTLSNLLEGERLSEPADWSVIRSLLNAFLLVLARTSRSMQPFARIYRDHRVTRLLGLIDAHHVVERSPQFYADAFGLSANRLNQIARQSFGRTVVQLVHDRLVLEARRELGVTDRDVQAIGHRLGFDDPSYFTRFFRRETGQTPVEFRETVQVTPQPLLPFEQAV